MPEEKKLDERRHEAQVALAGAEWTAKSEHEAQAKRLASEQATLTERLAKINKEKETFELDWINLDEKRKQIRLTLAPLQADEKKVEEEETALEAEEARIGLPRDKRAVEEKRWAIQERRRQAEEKRWTEEEKLTKLDAVIETNTGRYRILLDEEGEIKMRLEQIKAEGTML